VTVDGRPSTQESIQSDPAPRPTRRWLAGALCAIAIAGLVAGGFVGAGRYISTYWLYRGFPQPSAPHSITVHGRDGGRRVPVVLPTVQTITVRSAALGGYADPVFVVVPPGYASHPGQRYPVLYLLHGFPGLPTGFLDIGQVSTTEATLLAAGRMKPIILVIPTGSRSFLADHQWVNGIGKGNGWETFVAHDLIKAVDARYRTIPSARGRGLAGLSEGAYAALNIGLHHPGGFGLLESWSGYMRAERKPAIFGHGAHLLAYNSPTAWIASVASQLRANRTYVWFYIGARDPLSAQNRAFAVKLTALGVMHHFFTLQGTHNWRLWRSQMPHALITASEHLSHG
jgi:enterochelin esterase-like enzyme